MSNYESLTMFRGLQGDQLKAAIAVYMIAEEVTKRFGGTESDANPPPQYLMEFYEQFFLPALKRTSPLAKWVSVKWISGTTKEMRYEYFANFTAGQLALRYAMIRQWQDGVAELSGKGDLWGGKKMFIEQPVYYYERRTGVK